MSRGLYIAALQPDSGKSLVLLGVMELLSRRIQRLGFFRPVVASRDTPDNDIELVRTRYGPVRAQYAVTHEEAQNLVGAGKSEELLRRILETYRAVAGESDYVVCEGTDFTGITSAFEFGFNATIASHLDCPTLIVANGRGQSAGELAGLAATARGALEQRGCDLAATIINRVDPSALAELREHLDGDEPVFALPEQPLLAHPTVADVARGLDAQLLYPAPHGMERVVLEYKVAAMHLPHFLEHLHEGTLVITPGDRSDIILGSLATVIAAHRPRIAGLLLSGGLAPEPPIRRLLDGFDRPPIPILCVEEDTFTTATRVDSVRAAITADNQRKIATALGVFESNVDQHVLAERISADRSHRVTPLMFEYELIDRARSSRARIVLPEGEDERILRASDMLLRRDVVELTLLGNAARIRAQATALDLDLSAARVIDPADSGATRDAFAAEYHQLRQHKGVTLDAAREAMLDVNYFGTMMVYRGDVDGMVSGAAHTTGQTIRPALQFIRTVPGCEVVSSVFLMCLADRVLVYGDCAVNPNPTPAQLADIAISSAATATLFGIEARVAMLSYSTGESGQGEDVERVREATDIVRARRPDLDVEGPIQYDAAVDAGVARQKMPDSTVAGRATVLIFPDLNTGNNTYKAVQRSADAVAIGPVLQGLRKPVNDLSRGCTVADIVNTVAITAIQAGCVRASPRQ